MDSSEKEAELEDSNSDVNQLLLELLVLSCHGDAGDILQYEMVQPTGRAAWLRIQSRYAGSTSVKIASLYIDLFRQVTVLDADSSIVVINKWFTGWKSLAALGHELKPEAICAIAELSLPVSIFSITFSHMKMSGSPLTVPQLMDRLRSVAVEASIRVGRESSTSQGLLATSSKPKRKPKSGQTEPRKCTFCQGIGHGEEKCYKKHGYPPGHPRASKEQAANAATLVYSQSDGWMVTEEPADLSLDAARSHDFGLTVVASDLCEWIVDSGATSHMTGFASDFSGPVAPIQSPGHRVRIADGTFLEATGRGSVVTTTLDARGVRVPFIVRDVILVPGLAARLFSVNRVCKNGARVIFSPGLNGCYIERGDVRIVIKSLGSSYILSTNFDRAVDFSNVATVPPPSSGSLVLSDLHLGASAPGIWHSRCGHVGAAKLRDLRRSGLLGDFGSIGHEFCVVCIRAKLASPPHLWSPVPLAANPGDYVHCDIAGLFPPSVNGYRWQLNFVDRCSRALPYLGFCATKDMHSVANLIETFITTVCRPRNITLRVLFSDNGTEFKNDVITALSVKYCFRQEFTATGTPSQNGLAERANRTIAEMTRAMLFHSAAPVSLWTCAASTAAYLITRMPCAALSGDIPFSRWYGTPVKSLSHLRVWGCPVFWKVDTHKTKLEQRSREGIFVGYSSGTRSYRIYDPVTRRFSESRDCVFDETFRTKQSVPAPALVTFADFDMPLRHDPSIQQVSPGTLHDSPSVVSPHVPEAHSPVLFPFSSQTVASPSSLVIPHVAPSTLDVPSFSAHVPIPMVSLDPDSQYFSDSVPAVSDPGLTPALKKISSSSTLAHKYPTISDNHDVASGRRLRSDGATLAEMDDSAVRQSDNTVPLSVDYAFRAAYLAADASSGPRSYAEAMRSSVRQSWEEAVDSELQSMLNQKVFRVTPRGSQNVVRAKWVFRVKRDAQGNVSRYKARLVAQGQSQVHGVDYFDSFAPVVRFETIRTNLAHAVLKKKVVHQSDVETAFLLADLEEECYLEVPDGFVLDLKLLISSGALLPQDLDNVRSLCQTHGSLLADDVFGVTPELRRVLCLRLLKCIYGLHQSSRRWYKKLHKILCGLGFERSQVDPCSYSRVRDGVVFVVLIYVDDIIQIADSESEIAAFQAALDKHFKLKHMGKLHFILGVEVLHGTDGSMLLRQTAYIRDLVLRFGVSGAKCPLLPAEPNEFLSADDGAPLSPMDTSVFQSLIGSLLYVSVGTRPDISSALRAVSRFMSSPTVLHMQAATRILKYLAGTAEKGIKYSPLGNSRIISYSDADFANDPDSRRSVSGGLSILAGAAITWVSTFQPLVSQSSCESEYVALALQVQQCLFLKQLCISLRLDTDVKEMIIYEDNQSTIDLSKDWIFRKRTKHIDVKYHLVRHHVIGKDILLCYQPTESMLADMLTKPQTKFIFQSMRDAVLGEKALELK